MSYVKHTWVNNEAITASKMNNIEDGIEEASQSGGGGAMIVTSSIVNGAPTMDKTVQEIYDALMSGTPVYYKFQYGTIGEDYITHAWLAPITYVYTYEVTSFIRVVVNRPFSADVTGTGSSGDYLLVPSTLVFQAVSMNDYPTYYKTVRPTAPTTYSDSVFYS